MLVRVVSPRRLDDHLIPTPTPTQRHTTESHNALMPHQVYFVFSLSSSFRGSSGLGCLGVGVCLYLHLALPALPCFTFFSPLVMGPQVGGGFSGFRHVSLSTHHSYVVEPNSLMGRNPTAPGFAREFA